MSEPTEPTVETVVFKTESDRAQNDLAMALKAMATSLYLAGPLDRSGFWTLTLPPGVRIVALRTT